MVEHRAECSAPDLAIYYNRNSSKKPFYFFNFKYKEHFFLEKLHRSKYWLITSSVELSEFVKEMYWKQFIDIAL